MDTQLVLCVITTRVWFIRFFHTTKDLGDPGSSRGTLERVRVDLTVSAVVARGEDPNKMTARKIWDLPLQYSLLDVMCSVCRRGGCVQYTCIGGGGDRQMRQKARVLTLIGVLTSSAVG